MSGLFPASATPIPIESQIAEIERELGQRKHVYPRLIDSGRLTKAKAEQQVDAMKAALATLKKIAAAAPPGGGSAVERVFTLDDDNRPF